MSHRQQSGTHVSIVEAARTLGISRIRVHQLIDAGRINYEWIGNRFKAIRREELARFARERAREKRS